MLAQGPVEGTINDHAWSGLKRQFIQADIPALSTKSNE